MSDIEPDADESVTASKSEKPLVAGPTGKVLQRHDGTLYEIWSDGSIRRMTPKA